MDNKVKKSKGRPKLDLDENQIEKYAKIGASTRCIADALGCDEAVIRRRCEKLLAKSRALRKIMLHKFQWDAAEAGVPSVLIFLGKNELGQSDQQTIKHSGEIKSQPKQSIDVEKFVTALASELEKRSGAADIVSERDDRRESADTDNAIPEATGLPK